MKITALKFLRGANVYSPHQVLVVTLAEFPALSLDFQTLQNLLNAAPFNLDIIDDGSWPAPVGRSPDTQIAWVARLAVLLQAQAGAQLEFHTAEPVSADEARAIFAFEDEICAQEAGWLATALINCCISVQEPGAASMPRPQPGQGDLAGRLNVFNQHAPLRATDLYTLPMLDAASERHIPWSRVHNSRYYRLGSGSRQRLLLESSTQANNWIANQVCRDKALSQLLLLEQGLPVPFQITVNSEEEAVQAAQEIGYPVVVKPPNMHQGTGVHLNLRSDAAVRTAFTAAQKYCPAILVEQYVVGRDYRLLVVGDELVAAAWRRPPQVTGDGTRTILALIAELNLDPLRNGNNRAPLVKIAVDDEVTRTLAEQDLALGDVPAEGRTIALRRLPSVSLGGQPLDQLHRVHPDNEQLVIDAAATSGLAIAGVDYLSPDISKSHKEVGGVICETNAVPGLNAHFDMPGGMVAVAGKIIDHTFPDAARSRIPVIVAPGEAQIIRQLADACSNLGHRPGLWLEGKLIINGREPATEDSSQIAALLHSPLVDVACLAPAPNSLLRDGLGFDRASWAVLLSHVIPPEGAALLARYCEKILLLEHAAIPEDWPVELRTKIVRLPAVADPVDWLARRIDESINQA